MTLSDEQIQELLHVGNPTDEECRLIRMGWDAAMRTKRVPDGWKLVPIDPTRIMLDCMDLGSNMLYRYRALLAAAPEAKP